MGLWSWVAGLFRRKKPERPLVSLVLFLREPRYLDAEILKAAVRKAWGIGLEGERDFVIGEPPALIVQAGERVYLVNAFSRPYVDDPEKAAEGVADLRLRKRMAEHRAWISVDLLAEIDPGAAYRDIGKLVAELAADDCLMLFSPELTMGVPYDPSLDGILRGENPLEAVRPVNRVPVFSAADDDPKMKAAVAEARRRWPEFAEAFARREPDQDFAVKAPFTDGGTTEHMWVLVSTIDDDSIRGRLDSDPVHVTTPRCGDRVTVKQTDITDWVYTRGHAPVGAFTARILAELQKERQRKR